MVVFTLLHRSFEFRVNSQRSQINPAPASFTSHERYLPLAGGRIEKLSVDADPDNDSFVRAERHALVHILSNAIEMG